MSYQPKTGARCTCRPGVWRDNCPNCEGTGMVIDFRLIRSMTVRHIALDATLARCGAVLPYPSMRNADPNGATCATCIERHNAAQREMI